MRIRTRRTCRCGLTRWDCSALPEALRARRVRSGRGSSFRHGRGVFGTSGGSSGDCGFAFEVGGTDGRGALRKGKARPVFAIPDKESRTKSGVDCGGDSCRDQTYCASGYSGGGEQYMYKNPSGRGEPLIVSHHPRDADHPCPHWHVGQAKMAGKDVATFNNGDGNIIMREK